MASNSYRVYVAQYQRGVDSRTQSLPFHWQICVRISKEPGPTGRSTGTVFHIIGSHNGWGYERKDNITYSATQNWAGCHFVGTIPKDQIPEIDQILQAVPLHPHKQDWNCQNWILSGLKAIKQRGFQIWAAETQGELENVMIEAFKTWNSGQDSD